MTSFGLADKMALLAHMIDQLHNHGSWCGETHIQKAIYLLQHAGAIPLEYDYILYKHGPYSFDLSGELGSMRGANLIELVFPLKGYGPSFALTENGRSIMKVRHQKLNKALAKADLIADWLGRKDVKSLERIATAYFVHEAAPNASQGEKAASLKKLKPHVNDFDAIAAVSEVTSKLPMLAD